jgi:hypothetical protein
MVLLPTRAELPVCSSSFMACSADIPGAASAGRACCGVVAAEARVQRVNGGMVLCCNW